MDRYSLAAGLAVVALACAGPAAARGVHHPGTNASRAERCAVSARRGALATPLAGDRALAARIEQLTGVIADLSDRLASLEQKLASPGDKDDQGADEDSADDAVTLASARRHSVPGPTARPSEGAARAEAPAV